VDDVAEIAGRLSAASRRARVDPYAAIEWPDAIDPGAWYTSPGLISIYGTRTWHELSEERRRQLSFWEAVNFYSLNIHGERALMEGLARRLYAPGLEAVTEYLHHFLGEENNHSIWFGTFCRRYAGKVYPERVVAFPREFAEGEADFLFFAKVVIFEEIVDRYNMAMAADENLDPLARQINANHHSDERRHLAFGRRIVTELWNTGSRRWPAHVTEGIRLYLDGFVGATWREYYNPDMYRDAGFSDPWMVARGAWDHPTAKAHRRAITQQALRPLQQAGVLGAEVAG